MNFTLKVWRQKSRDDRGGFKTYPAAEIPPDASFLEMLDVVNEQLIKSGEEPIAFDHDCREGICGSCGLMINGRAHGPQRGGWRFHRGRALEGTAVPDHQGPHRRSDRA